MLVLTRREQETIVFPGLDITIRVVRIKGGGVRLGIEAPPAVVVLRGELAEATAVKPCLAVLVSIP